MQKLIKVNQIQVDGFEGNETVSSFYVISDLENIKDDEKITREEVQEADVVFLVYNKYVVLGYITENEIEVLTKFGII